MIVLTAYGCYVVIDGGAKIFTLNSYCFDIFFEVISATLYLIVGVMVIIGGNKNHNKRQFTLKVAEIIKI